MYEKYYGLRERPFSLLPDPEYLYLGRHHKTAVTLLEYGLVSGSPITVITGEIGSGKTTLVRYILERLKDDVSVGLISNTHKSFGDLMHWVLMAFGLDFEKREKPALYQSFMNFLIEQYSHGKRTVLIVDEAQNMDPEMLEELRLLTNINADKDEVLQLVLLGQPELKDTLRAPGLEQFAQRVAVSYHLRPLLPKETARYIEHRLKVAGGNPEIFDDIAKRYIHYQTGGIPRLINTLCDLAMVYGYAGQRKTIDTEILVEVVHDKNKGGLFISKNTPVNGSPHSSVVKHPSITKH